MPDPTDTDLIAGLDEPLRDAYEEWASWGKAGAECRAAVLKLARDRARLAALAKPHADMLWTAQALGYRLRVEELLTDSRLGPEPRAKLFYAIADALLNGGNFDDGLKLIDERARSQEHGDG